MTRRAERMVLEIAYDDERQSPPHTWSWEHGVELKPGTVKVLAFLTPEATRALSDEPTPDPYGNRPPRRERFWEAGL